MENSTCNNDTPIILPERYVDLLHKISIFKIIIYIYKSVWFRKQYVPKQKAEILSKGLS